MKTWHHAILWLVIGVALAYYVPALPGMTLGKIYPAR